MTGEKTSRSWLRLWSCAVDDDKLRILAFEDRWHYIAILCCKAQGILDDQGPFLRRRVAIKLGLDAQTLDDVERRLCEVGLINKGTFEPVAWNRRQYESDRDPTNAERQRRYRASKQ